MKTYELSDIMKMLQNKGVEVTTKAEQYQEENGYTIEQYDAVKTKLLKYITYKKRTENEVKTKFAKDIDKDILEDAIEELKNLGYISDANYIDRAVNEFIALRNMSIREIKYKLLSKGINKNIIEDYFNNYEEKMNEYELQSAKNICIKKCNSMEMQEIKVYLIKKGYKEDIIKEALEDI